MTARFPMRFSPRENRAAEIGWREWGEKPFEEAKRDGKLVLLSISAAWCHWCHVMDETTYSDPEVIELIQRHYVPIRVDTDLQPEINRRYNQGGWPTTAFLDPEGRLLAGATYIPPETMKKVLSRMFQLYTEHREELQWRQVPFPVPKPVEDLRKKSLEIAALLPVLWDRVHGGLGDAPKFPLPEALLLALDVYHLYGAEDFIDFAHHSLHSMVTSGLFDSPEGGFFRYSVTSDWNEPHYEKLLEDNALLLLALHGAAGTKEDELLSNALKATADYVNTVLYRGEGIFLPSQDADEDYYRLSREERLYVDKPMVDPIPLTRPASTASRALILAGSRLGEELWLKRALEALDRIAATFESDGGVAHVYGENPIGKGHLEDQSAFVLGLLDAYALTGNRELLELAIEVMRLVAVHFKDKTSGLLMDLPKALLPPRLQTTPAGPEALGEVASAMTWIWALKGDRRWREEAFTLLSKALSLYADTGVHASPLARAGLLLSERPLMAKIPGGPDYYSASRMFLSLPLSFLRPVPHEAGGHEPPYQLCRPDCCLASGEEAADLLRQASKTFLGRDPDGGEEG